jgi:hypothetical protein
VLRAVAPILALERLDSLNCCDAQFPERGFYKPRKGATTRGPTEASVPHIDIYSLSPPRTRDIYD